MQDAHFDPIFPAHAIERCAATVVFEDVIPPQIADQAVELASAKLDAKLNKANTAGVQLSFDAATGKLSVVPGGPTEYQRGADGPRLTVMPNIIVWQTDKYVRWDPFFGEFNQVVGSVLRSLLSMSKVSAIKLEYWDRFIWTGSMEKMDPWALLKKNLPLVALGAARAGASWHSHCGWFEPQTKGIRRLVNVNVDVLEIKLQGAQKPSPTVGIYTMCQDDFGMPPSGNFADVDAISMKLVELHVALKRLLSDIICDEMQKRISLKVEASHGST
jgi:uncharacterized protein (TIGR04255 family)